MELIVAMSENGCIGKDNKIPWYLSEDLQHFRKLTENSIIIMGRKTFESLPNGPLKNRLNIIITRNRNYTSTNENVIISDMINIFNILNKYKHKYNKIFVIGGADIFKLFISYCNSMHITYIHEQIEGDVYFETKLFDNFTLSNKTDILISKNNIKYSYYTYNAKNIYFGLRI